MSNEMKSGCCEDMILEALDSLPPLRRVIFKRRYAKLSDAAKAEFADSVMLRIESEIPSMSQICNSDGFNSKTHFVVGAVDWAAIIKMIIELIMIFLAK
jgi:hypothetical protein